MAILYAVLLLFGESVEAYLPAPYGGRLAAPLVEAPVSLNPAQARRMAELQITTLIYETLYTLGANGLPHPQLVEPKPEISAAGKEWRFQLRPGLRLTSGRALLAADVAASLKRTAKGPHAYLLAAVKMIEATSPTQLVIRLDHAVAELPWLLSAPATAIAVVEGDRLVGSGPYLLDRRSRAELQLKPHLLHHAGRPYLDEVVLKVFDRSSAELGSFQVGTIQMSLQGQGVFGGKPRHPTLEVESEPIHLLYLGFGRGQSWLGDPAFRRALLQGIDRRRLVRLAAVGKSDVAESPVPRSLSVRGLKKVPFNRAAASRSLARLAMKNPAVKTALSQGRLKLSLLIDGSRFQDVIVAGQIVADLDRLQITATMEVKAAAEFEAQLAKGTYDLALGHQLAQVPLLQVALAGALAAAGDQQRARQCLATKQSSTKALRRFMQELPLLPLVHTSVRIYYDARLGPFRPGPLGLVPFADLFWRRSH